MRTSRVLQFAICGFLAAGITPVMAAGSAPKPTICTRSCWGARAPSGSISQMSALTRAIVHHTAGNEFNTTSYAASQSYVRAIQNLHMNGNGWSDIGYHFLVDKFGNTFEGRSGSMTSLPKGAHDGTNSNSFGFNFMGYFHTPVNNKPTLSMLDAAYDVMAWRMPSAWRPYGSPGVYGPLGLSVGYLDGHRRVKSTACPGDYIFNSYIGTNLSGGAMRNEVNARIVGSSTPSYPPRTVTGVWKLSNVNGSSGVWSEFTYGSSGRVALAGDWNGDGVMSIGTWKDGAWSLCNSTSGGSAQYSFTWGSAGQIPVVGDWDGNGTDTPGVFDNGTWKLSNVNDVNGVNIQFSWGTNSSGKPVVGDWNGDGIDTPGFFKDGVWKLSNKNDNNGVDLEFSFGGATSIPITGDWDGNGTDTIGVFSGGYWNLRNSNSAGTSSAMFQWGNSGFCPAMGDWDNNGTHTPGGSY